MDYILTFKGNAEAWSELQPTKKLHLLLRVMSPVTSSTIHTNTHTHDRDMHNVFDRVTITMIKHHGHKQPEKEWVYFFI